MADVDYQVSRAEMRGITPPEVSTKGSDRSPFVQRKLVVGASNDQYEREADAMAEQVVRRLSSPLDATVHRILAAPVSRISRKAAVIGAEGGNVDGDTERAIKSSNGQPMEPMLRRRMEGAFGADFSDIRMHVGAGSDALNERVQARAFTTGSNIFVRQQDYSPGTKSGERLLAHELAHTVQQGGAGAQRSLQSSSDTIQRLFGFGKKNTDAGKATARSSNANISGAKTAPRSVEPDDVHGSINDSSESATGLLGTTSTVTDTDSYRDDIAKATDGKDATGTDKTTASAGDTAKMGVAGGAGDLANMFIGISKAVKVFIDEDKSSAEKAGAALEIAGSITGGGKGIAGMYKGATTTGKATDGADGAKEASGILSGLTDSITAVKEGFFIVKGIIELATEAAGMSDEEKFKASMDVIRRSMEAAKSVVSTIKTFLDLAGSGVSGAMVNTIPGLGIAIGCAELVVRGVDLVLSLMRSSEMKTSKRDIKKAMNGGTSSNGKSMKDTAELWLRTGTPEQKAQASEYLTAKSLQYVNDKRSRRALLKIGVAMAKIAGDAATLGGASAPVGIGLKIGAVALDIGAGIFRKFKQWARDKVAKAEESNTSGKPGFLAKIFNIEKSTEKKTLEYNRIIDNVLDMIVAAAPAAPAATADETKKMLKAEAYLSAMGFSIEQLDREAVKGGPNLYKKMLEALKKRE